MTQEKLNEILDTLDWERDNLHFIESSPRDEWTERNAKRKRITIQALKMASEALERQMPKKPTTESTRYGLVYDCSVCNCGLEPHDGYCSRCGQAIDWED